VKLWNTQTTLVRLLNLTDQLILWWMAWVLSWYWMQTT
jgi:hypothetical protein